MAETEDLSFEILNSLSMNSYDMADSRSLRSSSSDRSVGPQNSSPAVSTAGAGMPSLRSSKEPRSRDLALEILLRNQPRRSLTSIPKLKDLDVEFPSLSASQLTEADFNKLQAIVEEYQHLKQNLLQANAVIRQYFSVVEKWQNDVKESRTTDRKRITVLLGDKMTLSRQVEQLEAERQAANQLLAEKCKELEAFGQLRQQQQQQQQVVLGSPAGDMIPRQTYKAVERQLSELLAHNLQYKDMEQNYIEEIQCLKANQTAMQTLQGDLDRQREANRKMFEDLNNAREQNQVLIQQAEIFHKDFLQERDARQRMAGEREQLLAEINELRTRIPGCHIPKRFTCPACYTPFPTQDRLGEHLQNCSSSM